MTAFNMPSHVINAKDRSVCYGRKSANWQSRFAFRRRNLFGQRVSVGLLSRSAERLACFAEVKGNGRWRLPV